MLHPDNQSVIKERNLSEAKTEPNRLLIDEITVTDNGADAGRGR